MQEKLGINVKYTLKDLREYSFAKERSGIQKAMFIFRIVFAIMLTLGIAAVIPDFVNGVENGIYIVIVTIVLLLFICSFDLLGPFLVYLRLRDSFKKSKLLGILQCYRFFDDRLEIISETGSFTLWWRDVYSIRELRPCFVIQPSPGKIHLVPRRCFESQEQLDLFMNIIESGVGKRKIKLKGYKLKNSSPDHGEIKTSECTDQTAEIKNEQGEPILEVQCSILRDEYVGLNFRLYYTKPAGLLVTAIGVLFIYSSIRNLSFNPMSSFVALALGVTFIFFIPLKLYFSIIKRYENDAAIRKPYIIEFYDEYFVVGHPDGANKILYSDLVRVIEKKTAIMLFVTINTAHIVPKRAFEGREDELKALRDLLRQKGCMK